MKIIFLFPQVLQVFLHFLLFLALRSVCSVPLVPSMSYADKPLSTPANAENASLVLAAHGLNCKKELHPKHWIDPANELAVRALHATAWEEGVTGFEYITQHDNKGLVFHGYFLDRASYPVCCRTPAHVLRTYPRGNALVSLLHEQRFPGVEAFAVACQNALGEDIESVPLFFHTFKVMRTPAELSAMISRGKPEE